MRQHVPLNEDFASILPDAKYMKIPMADGGEGTVQSLVDATGGTIVKQVVTGPLGKPVDAFLVCWEMGRQLS